MHVLGPSIQTVVVVVRLNDPDSEEKLPWATTTNVETLKKHVIDPNTEMIECSGVVSCIVQAGCCCCVT